MYIVAVHGASRPRAVGANWRIAANHWPRLSCTFLRLYERVRSFPKPSRRSLGTHPANVVAARMLQRTGEDPHRSRRMRHPQSRQRGPWRDAAFSRERITNIRSPSGSGPRRPIVGPPRLIVLRRDGSHTDSVGPTSICGRSHKNGEEALTAPAQSSQRRLEDSRGHARRHSPRDYMGV